MPSTSAAHGPFTRAVAAARRTLRRVAFFSFFVNLLVLTSSVYMLQVYDRVLASRSLPTLVYLTVFAAACLGVLALLEVVRSRLLVRLGVEIDAEMGPPVFERTLLQGRSAQALRDLSQVRGFATGSTMLSLLDAPWTPVYLALVYLLHPWLGHVALVGAVALFTLGWWNEVRTRAVLGEAGRELHSSAQFAEVSARNMEVVRAMGMLPALARLWSGQHGAGLHLQSVASDRAADVAAVTKSLRLFLQIAILGVGAWLVIRQESTAGVMIAASIIVGRALAPVESAIGNWRSFIQTREAYGRLAHAHRNATDVEPPMTLPAPSGRLSFEEVAGGPPGALPTVRGVSFTVDAGTCVGITGPSGAGKSSLVRLALGIWPASHGTVRLDGADIKGWDSGELGPYVGYLPQDIEIFPGTVAQNIARFGAIDPALVVEAAQLAGAHTTILHLPQGYDTPLGPGGANLSGGQRQRIGLARALYSRPSFIVLDEPTSHLDAEGEMAVRQMLETLKARGATVLIIAHRPALLGGTDRLMVVLQGKVASDGPTHEVMPALTRRSPALPTEPGVATHG